MSLPNRINIYYYTIVPLNNKENQKMYFLKGAASKGVSWRISKVSKVHKQVGIKLTDQPNNRGICNRDQNFKNRNRKFNYDYRQSV